MVGPNRNREVAEVKGAGLAGRHTGSRADLWRGVQNAMAAVLFCAGVMLMPALAAVDLSIGLACQNLDHSACIALFQPQTE